MNHKIRVPQVRVIGADGKQVGVLATFEAIRMAESSGLDLVEISPTAVPPVCRIMDYGKFKYEENQREKQARKHQASVVLKEVKFHSNVDDNDYATKAAHIRGFLEKGHRVKTSLFFRGRENEHRDLGYKLFSKLIKDCESCGVPEAMPRLFGNNLVVMFRSIKGTKPETKPATSVSVGANSASAAQAPVPAVVNPVLASDIAIPAPVAPTSVPAAPQALQNSP